MNKMKVCMTIEGGRFKAYCLKRKLIKAMRELCKYKTAEEIQKILAEEFLKQGYTVTQENGCYVYTKGTIA
jgi:hypothetical protein